MRKTFLFVILSILAAACSSTTGGSGGGNATITGCPATGWIPAGAVGATAHFDCASGQGFGCHCAANGVWMYEGTTPCNASATCPAASCSYGGQTHMAGETFSASDGCNTCTCGSFGQVDCTTLFCPTDAGAE